MKHFVLLAFLMTCSLHGEEVAENGDFAKGLNHWSKEGRIDAGEKCLVVTLNDHKWTLIEQEVKLAKEPPSSVTVKVEMTVSADFKPEEKSKEYSSEDFAMGGSYGWSARVFPKADFMIQFSNAGGWDYRPVQLKADGSTQIIAKDIDKLKEKKGTLTLAFPPGVGTITIKSISVDLKAPAAK